MKQLNHFYFCKILFFVLPLLVFSKINAQPSPPTASLESPYHTIFTHLYYLQPDSYQPFAAAKAFNVEDSIRAKRLAIQLKQVLDGGGLFVYMNLLPQENNFKDSVSQRSFYTLFPDELPEVYLEKKDGKWFYSEQTIKAVPELYRKLFPFGTDFLVNLFPDSAHQKFVGLAIWQWVGIGLLFLLAFLVQWLLSRGFRPLVSRLAKSRYSSPLEDKNLLWKVSRLASFAVLLWLLKAAMPLLQLPVQANAFLITGLKITGIIVAVLLGLSIVEVVMMYALRYASSTVHKLDEQLIPILRKLLKIIVVVVGLIYVLQLLDVNVTALIAGVSIGGLALALAAQDTVRNLIGSAMIFFDKPFEIGDWIDAGGTEGEVIEVGFRSTRIQSIDSSIIAVPNNLIASASVKNMGIRRYRYFKTTLGIIYDTPPVLIKKYIKGLRRLIEEHPHTRKDNYLVHFHSFGDSALHIYLRAYLTISSFTEEMAVKEELSFGILQLAEALGVQFAFPTQTLMIEKMPGNISLSPGYEKDGGKLEERLEDFFKKEE